VTQKHGRGRARNRRGRAYAVPSRPDANKSAARAQISAANASAKLALAHFDGTVLKALGDTESALNVYVHDLRREESLKAARDDAARVESDAERLEVGGRATALEVIDAQRTLASAEQSLAQLVTAISADQVATFLALGGGWESGQIVIE
jgi:multidrug efflux system outer membrane protein